MIHSRSLDDKTGLGTAVVWRGKNIKLFVFYKYFCLGLKDGQLISYALLVKDLRGREPFFLGFCVSSRTSTKAKRKRLSPWKVFTFGVIICLRISALVQSYISKVLTLNTHYLLTVAGTIDCVCGKILDCGLNHGLLFSLFKFFG